MASIRVAEDVEKELLRIVQDTWNANSNDDTFYVGLSGGSLPQLLIKVFRQLENVDWKKWLFFFCDERCVPSSSDDSTFGQYKRLLNPVDERLPLCLSQFITIDPALKSNKVAEDYVSKMRQRFDKNTSFPKFHLMLLGLGPDGHTCSLFPDHRLLKESNKWIAYIGDSPKPPPERITMTLPLINNSKSCVFVATGEGKAQVVRDILNDNKPLPAGLVKPTNGSLIWLLDKAAASKL